MSPFRKCDECGDTCLTDFMYTIKCIYHPGIENYIKCVCNNCLPQITDNKNWKLDLLNNYKVDIKKLEHSDITYYRKCNNYAIFKINQNMCSYKDGKLEYIKCDNCIETFIENNIPFELLYCDICNSIFNPNKLNEVECYGKCEKILNICKDCHKKIMLDRENIGLGTYEVCPDCIDDYLKNEF